MGDINQDQLNSAWNYENLLVSALITQWSEEVVDAASIQLEQQVLDVACGTGVLARHARSRVGRFGKVAAIDPNPAMLQVASSLESDIDWHLGTAESLPFPDNSFDAVISQFGLMFFTDHLAGVQQMLRVLKPSGRLAIAVWDSIENIPAYAAEVALLDRIAGEEAGNAVRIPFELGDKAYLQKLLSEAGVTSASVATIRKPAFFPSIRTMVGADIDDWLPIMGIALSEKMKDELREEAEKALAPFINSQGLVEFEMSAHIMTGTKK